MEIQICNQLFQQRFDAPPASLQGFDFYQNTGSVAACQAACAALYTSKGSPQAFDCNQACSTAPGMCSASTFDRTEAGCSPSFSGSLSDQQRCNAEAGPSCTAAAISSCAPALAFTPTNGYCQWNEPKGAFHVVCQGMQLRSS